jgi:thiaminase
LWNTSLSMMAFQQYLYQDNRFLTSVPEVAAALDQVFLVAASHQSRPSSF